MEPRKITKTYLGRYLGLASASSFLPGKNIPDYLVIIVMLSTILLVGVYRLTLPPPAWDRTFTVNGQEYHDDDFTKNFNYSQLTGKTIKFLEPLNRSEFNDGSNVETEVSFSDLEELERILSDLGAPNIVKYYAL